MPNGTRRLPYRHELEALTGATDRPLGWAEGPGGVVVANAGMLVARLDGQWRSWGWEQVLRGGWREEDSALFWEVDDGENYECLLDSPGELLSIFRERVLASTVMTSSHDLPNGAVQIIARRNLRDGNVTWLASASGGASLKDPGTAAFVVAETDRLRAEYGL
jgi:hypothetical protein